MLIRKRIDDGFLYYFNSGKCVDSYNIFGAHLVKGKNGKNIACEFTLYAPNAARVNLIGEWDNFNEESIELECISSSGVWYAKVEGDLENKAYKYIIYTEDGRKLYKADPYAFYSEFRPSTNSVVYETAGYTWEDNDWMYTHPKTYENPLLIYEMHLGSWKRHEDGSFYSFRELAPMLVDYLNDFGYTHVELMPIYEHPLDASWGYQGTGYYSVSSRYGTPKDFMYFVDYLHKNGIGVIMDWVPGHICKDSHGLYNFDGSWLYDYPNECDRENKEWGTANLDLGKGITRSFLYSNAMFYLKNFHIDGFRVDAVSNLIYYLGDCNRGVNSGACDFLRELSTIIFGYDDRVLLMAEDSSSFPNVTKPSDSYGLGFNYKWDMGWMNDTLKYFKLDPIYRKFHHYALTFSMVYNYNEQFTMPLSHDEVVHMKGSLLNKMPGDYWQKFANYKTMIGYMMTHPGKKLLFMGSELAPFSEWHYEGQLDWNLLTYPSHDSVKKYFMDLTNFYKNEKALWELDFSRDGFNYIDADNMNESIYVYSRFAKNPKDNLVIVMNCTPNTYHDYRIGVPGDFMYEEVINSDKDIYGGSNVVNSNLIPVENFSYKNQKHSILINVPPLGITILKAVNNPTDCKKKRSTASKK